jgi:hypothetical protein
MCGKELEYAHTNNNIKNNNNNNNNNDDDDENNNNTTKTRAKHSTHLNTMCLPVRLVIKQQSFGFTAAIRANSKASLHAQHVTNVCLCITMHVRFCDVVDDVVGGELVAAVGVAAAVVVVVVDDDVVDVIVVAGDGVVNDCVTDACVCVARGACVACDWSLLGEVRASDARAAYANECMQHISINLNKRK